MASSLSKPTKLTILALPDDILVKVFRHLTDPTKYTLYSSKDALNLARSSKRLHQIFGTQLKRITPVIDSRAADSLSPLHLKALLRIAGANLRELHIPNCSYYFLNELPDLCPNLKVLHFVEGYHYPTEVGGRDPHDDNEDDNNNINNSATEEDTFRNGDSSINGTGASNDETGDMDPDENDNSANDVDPVSEDNIIAQSDDENGSVEISDSDYDCLAVPSKCPAFEVLPRLQLRKLLVRDPRAFFNSIIPLAASQYLQELHLFNVRKHRLPLLIPLLSLPLTSLTITMDGSVCDSYSEPVSKFIDALKPAASRMSSITVHFPSEAGLSTLVECSVNTDSFDFPDEATKLIASVRENNCQSKCTSADLSGDITFQILSVVNSNATITLSNDRITLCDCGQGTHITSLPLYEEFLDLDVTHLEKAYILQRWYAEGDGLVEYGWHDEWGSVLAGHRLRLVRTYDASVLNRLELSTEVLELFYTAVPNVDDWSFLRTVRELYLLGSPDDFGNDDGCATIAPVIRALPAMVDAFHGDFIWTSSYNPANCSDCSSPESALQHAKEAKHAVDRFSERGGDAATLQAYVEMLLTKLDEYIATRSRDERLSATD